MAGEDLIAVSRRMEQPVGVPPLIRLDGKVPLDAGWTTGPREDPDRWRSKLARHRGNVGLVTGHGLVVVDLDIYKPAGAETYRRSPRPAGSQPTVCCRTPRGGLHLYYRYDPDVGDIGCGDFARIVLPDGTALPAGPSGKQMAGSSCARPAPPMTPTSATDGITTPPTSTWASGVSRPARRTGPLSLRRAHR